MEGNKEKVRLAGRCLSADVLFLLGLSLCLAACSVPEKSPLAESKSMPTAGLQSGRILFNQYCASCHPEGLAGVGPGIVDKPLPAALIRFQIRNGIGVMPDFDEEVLSDEQVKEIAAYLVYVRQQD